MKKKKRRRRRKHYMMNTMRRLRRSKWNGEREKQATSFKCLPPESVAQACHVQSHGPVPQITQTFQGAPVMVFHTNYHRNPTETSKNR
jgi:hypothetical protein